MPDGGGARRRSGERVVCRGCLGGNPQPHGEAHLGRGRADQARAVAEGRRRTRRHIVSGHVDAVGTVAGKAAEGDSTRLTIEAPKDLAPFIASKGSIAIDGVSLTVNEVEDLPGGAVRFGVNLIPHTAEVTTLGTLAEGDEVNLEIDTVARYLKRLESLRS